MDWQQPPRARNGEGRLSSRGSPPNGKATFRRLVRNSRLSACQPQIEAYVCFLEGLNERLGADPIGSHYLKCFKEAYKSFICSGVRVDRYRTWVAVCLCLQWMVQLKFGGVS